MQNFGSSESVKKQEKNVIEFLEKIYYRSAAIQYAPKAYKYMVQ